MEPFKPPDSTSTSPTSAMSLLRPGRLSGVAEPQTLQRRRVDLLEEA